MFFARVRLSNKAWDFYNSFKQIRKMSKTPKNDLYFTQNFHSVGLCAVQKPVNWFWTDSLLILALFLAGREFWLNLCCFRKYSNHICYLLISFSVFFWWYSCTSVFISILFTRQFYYTCFTSTWIMSRKKNSEAPTRVFSCEFCEVFQYSFFGYFCSCNFIVFKKWFS